MSRTKIDRLCMTVTAEPGAFPDGLPATLRAIFPTGQGVSYHLEPVHPQHGYAQAQAVFVGGVRAATFSWGSPKNRHQDKRPYLDITGQGCGFVQDWALAEELLSSLPGARLNRVDVAADFLHGECTYEMVIAAHAAGEFKSARGGRYPELQTIEWSDRTKGYTAYIGSREGECHCCCYDKGLKEFGELGDAVQRITHGNPDALTFRHEGQDVKPRDWFRCEARFYRSSGRELAWEVLSDPDGYFAGCNPFFRRLLPQAAEAFFCAQSGSGRSRCGARWSTCARPTGRTFSRCW